MGIKATQFLNLQIQLIGQGEMIKILRVLLFPFSVVYGLMTTCRNKLFDLGVLASASFNFPVICVGNLSVGGTGKTPQIEYLIRLLQDKFNIVVLSRGYKRRTKGFVLADSDTKVTDIGDEPFQYHQKFEKIKVAVEANRVEGVKKIKELLPHTDIVLLDDAYQHRKIRAGFQILLTSYDQIFYQDFMMPTGNLRELWWGKNRADVIVVTKCPLDLSTQKQEKIKKRLKIQKHQQLFFSTITYAKQLKGEGLLQISALKNNSVILVTGIAKPQPLLDELDRQGIVYEHLKYPDHHHFSDLDIDRIQKIASGQRIVTTEKDYMRLEHKLENLYYLPIEIDFLNHQSLFDDSILEFTDQY